MGGPAGAERVRAGKDLQERNRGMTIGAASVRRGRTTMFEGEACRVIEFHHHTPGNLRAMVHAKLRKLKSGVTIEHRFRASDQMEEAVMETHTLQYLYHAGDTYHFMNTETYDQLEMDGEALGDAAQWMTDGMQIAAEFYNGSALAVDMPHDLTFDVGANSPVMRSATKTS